MILFLKYLERMIITLIINEKDGNKERIVFKANISEHNKFEHISSNL